MEIVQISMNVCMYTEGWHLVVMPKFHLWWWFAPWITCLLMQWGTIMNFKHDLLLTTAMYRLVL